MTAQVVRQGNQAPYVVALIVAVGISFIAGEKVGIHRASGSAPVQAVQACAGDVPTSQYAAMPDGAANAATEPVGADCNTNLR
jgi:hypothetical protein